MQWQVGSVDVLQAPSQVGQPSRQTSSGVWECGRVGVEGTIGDDLTSSDDASTEQQ
jgi:hypothetical protein